MPFQHRSTSKIAFGILLGVFIASFGGTVSANRTPEVITTHWGTEQSCSIYAGQTSINGIDIGDSKSKVDRILGNPTDAQYKAGILTCSYKGIQVKFFQVSKDLFSVCDMEATGKGFSTIDKVAVGMPEKVILETYGEADSIERETHEFPKLSKSRQQEYAKRRDRVAYTYNADERLSLTFRCWNGVIQSIKVHESD